MDYDYLFKVLLLGDSAVGKTCLMLRLCEDAFVEQHQRTVDYDFKIRKHLNFLVSKIRLQIWEAPVGFNTVKYSHYRSDHGIIILHDPSQPLDSLDHRLQEIDRYGWQSVCKLIVATKCDLKNNEYFDDVKELAEGLGITFMNVSAKNSINCEECLLNLVWDLLIRKGAQRITS